MREYAGDIIFQRGFSYYKQGRVRIEKLTETRITARVRGSGKLYLVNWFYVPENDRWMARCNCPYEATSVCKHIVATGLQANYLYESGINSLAVQTDTKKLPLAKIFDIEQVNERQNIQPDYTLVFKLSLKDETWFISPVARYIKKDGTFGREMRIASHDFNEERIRCTNEERFAAHLIWTSRRTQTYWYDIYDVPAFKYGSESGPLLPFLKDCIILLEREDIPIVIHPHPLHLSIRLSSTKLKAGKSGFQLQATLKDNSGFESVLNDSFTLLTGGNIILYRNYTLYGIQEKLDSRFLFPFLTGSGTIEFGSDELDVFYQSVLPHLSSAERIVELPDDMTIRVSDSITARKLYLAEKHGGLLIRPVFEYGDGNEVEYSSDKQLIITKSDSGYVRIERQDKVEEHAIQILYNHGLTDSGAGWFYPSRNKNPVLWLFEELPLLAAAGFTILGEEKLDKLKVHRATPKIISKISSGYDWFDLQAELDFDGMRVPIQEIMKTKWQNKNFILLSNGYTVQIDDEILKKIGFIDTFGQKTDNHQVRRFSHSHLLLLEQILQDSDLQQSDLSFQKSLAGIRKFTTIKKRAVPKFFQGELRPYQKAGFDWLHFLKEYRFGGCLADDMGLGKTVQALAFLLDVISENTGKPVLIVTPTSVIHNWAQEIERFTPLLDYYVYHGTDREKDPELLNNSHIILTSYALVWRDYDFLSKLSYYYIILDESQKIKNANALTTRSVGNLRSDHRLTLTGTPLENNLSELWSQFNFLNPGMLGSLKAFQDYFGRAIELNKDEATAEKLRKIIFPFMLRRKKDEVARELPPKTEIVTFCDMEEGQKKIYEKWRDYYRGAVLKKIDQDGLNKSKIKVLEGLTRLRQISIHPALVETHSLNLKSEKFNHLFEQLEEILSENHKVLVFSQFVKALSLLRTQLDQRSVDYAYLDGHTKNRSSQVERFQNEETCKVFLISLKAGGTGLNLTAADYVFHLDPWWNPAVEMQASDRAHRIGQDKHVFVYKLITRGSVEEKILDMQQKKKDLVDNIVKTDTAFFKNLSRSDIESLFA